RHDRGAADPHGAPDWLTAPKTTMPASGAGIVSNEWGSGALALTGGVLLAQLAALLLGGAAPDAGVLVGGECVFEAVVLGLAFGADGLGVLDLFDGGTGGAHGEEQIGVGVATGRMTTPFVGGDG